MPKPVEPETLRSLLSLASFQSNGDPLEQTQGHLISEHFPNCERFWQLFVVPATRRMDGYPKQLAGNNAYRPRVRAKVQDIIEPHYTTFVHLIRAHAHLAEQRYCWVEYSYTHLVCAIDLTEMFLKRCYRLLWELQEPGSGAVKGCTRKDFLQQHLEGTSDWKEWRRYAKPIRNFRNTFIHNTQIGRIIETETGQALIPKPTAVKRYAAWRKLYAVRGDRVKIERDFAEPQEQLRMDLTGLEDRLNQLWAPVIPEFESEFYSPTRPALRTIYDIEFPAESHDDAAILKPHCPSCGCQIDASSHTADVKEYHRDMPSGASGIYLDSRVAYFRCPACGRMFPAADAVMGPGRPTASQ